MGWEDSSVGKVLTLIYRNLWVWSQALHKLGFMEHAYSPHVEVEAEGTQIKSHCQLYWMFLSRLSYMTHVSNEQKTNKEKPNKKKNKQTKKTLLTLLIESSHTSHSPMDAQLCTKIKFSLCLWSLMQSALLHPWFCYFPRTLCFIHSDLLALLKYVRHMLTSGLLCWLTSLPEALFL